MRTAKRQPQTPETDTAEPKVQPFVPFAWHNKNAVETQLRVLASIEPKAGQIIAETMQEIQDSNMYWKMLSAWGDARDTAKLAGGGCLEADLALCARFYLAGTLRASSPLDEFADKGGIEP